MVSFYGIDEHFLLDVKWKIDDVTDSSMFKDKLQLFPQRSKCIRLISNMVSTSIWYSSSMMNLRCNHLADSISRLMFQQSNWMHW